MNSLLPLEYFRTIVTIPATAETNFRVILRGRQKWPLRIVGFQVNYPTGTTRDFLFRVSNRDGNREFVFMARTTIGGAVPNAVWKNLGETVGMAGDLDAVLPYIDIPPNGLITSDFGAQVGGGVMTINIFGIELTKNIIARDVLATTPQSISVNENNRVSLIDLPPQFMTQGGGGG